MDRRKIEMFRNRHASAVTLLNPKVIIFCMAFFVLFVKPHESPGLVTFAHDNNHCQMTLPTLSPCMPWPMPARAR